MRHTHWLAIGLLILSGCGVSSTSNIPATAPPTTAGPESSENTTADSGEEAPSNPALEDKAGSTSAGESTSAVTLVDDDGPLFTKYLEENKGKVILVDCWATWCGPCMAGFPKTVELHEKHQKEGLVVVSVSFDDMGDDDDEKKQRRDEALAFLQEKKATFKNFLAKTGIGTDAGKPFGVTINLPAFRVIDRQGKDRLDPKLSHEELENQLPGLVEELLNEQE